jgi:RHS repeat-associated protein
MDNMKKSYLLNDKNTGILTEPMYLFKMKIIISLIIVLVFVFLKISDLYSQVVLQDVIMGKAVVSNPVAVTMKAGFHAVPGSSFRAYIAAAQGQNSTYTVPVPSTNFTPLAGSSAKNFLKEITYREAKSTICTTSFKHLEEISYFDGIGRLIQKVSVGASPLSNDIIQPVLYDGFGRERYKTLPYTASKTGLFRTNVTVAIVNNYYSTTPPEGVLTNSTIERAYTETGFDDSPLIRVTSETGPGKEWESKSIHTNYLTNSSVVTSWNVDASGNFTMFYYQPRSLYIIETIDEQENATCEYKDKQGKVVQKASELDGSWLRTAYIYDEFDLLRCVVPPQATGPGDNAMCYYYKYDTRKRMIEKKIPGGGTFTMIYDNRDRLRCMQNNEQTPSEWSFTKYDQLNRPVITGVFTYTAGSAALEAAIISVAPNETRESTSTYYGYNNASFPGGAQQTVHTVTYYDNYDFTTSLNHEAILRSSTYDDNYYNFSSNLDDKPKGYVTGTMTRVLSASSESYTVPAQLLYSTSFYDKYGHLLRSISENHLGGIDVFSNIYEDITYLITKSKQQHILGDQTLTLEKFFEYDHIGRLLATREKVNSQAEFTLHAMKYNELGQLLIKYLHSGQTTGSRTFIQKVDYTYNIRGWLSKINDPLLTGDNDIFGMKLCYESTSALGIIGASAIGYFNGNIAGMKWGIKNDVVPFRGFVFTYDELNRLKTTNYAEGTSLNTSTGYYTESVTLYDKNGNIQGLQRKYNNILVDNLTYTYKTSSNQILKITDAGTSSTLVDDYPGTSGNYAYDDNGNMITDGSRNAALTYHNTINLPASVDFGNNNRIFYHYTAGGDKLLKHVDPASGTDTYTHYIGKIVYENGRISYIITEEGRMVNISSTSTPNFVYEYNLKDHLGNNRVTFMGSNLGGSVDVVQTTNYYPFGLVLSQTNNNISTNYSQNKYLYNGKEIQNDNLNGTFFGLLDYGRRMYDPQIGRFHVVDRFAEKFINTTPYQYALNNPIVNIDINGDTTYRFDQQGKYLGMYDLDAAGQVGSYGTTKTIGKGKDKQEIWDGQYFNFADPVNDSKGIRDGSIDRLVFVSEKDMQSMLDEQGAFESGKLNFGIESFGGGDFDYSFTALPKKYPEANFDGENSNSLFLPEGDNTAHNFMNFGNYLWGATGNIVGFDYGGLQTGAHANSLLNSRRNGYPAQRDSKDDQRSIIKGIYHSQTHNYRKLRK